MSHDLKLVRMIIANLLRQILMILKKKVENFHKNWQIFDESVLFKGMKSHDAGPGKPSFRYQTDH